ncbi:hypothetical protein [Micromonospora sp. SL4-19]|uniref:hypothetical protein n=1 Tax=Micromonospora sp. SL4-19 TaxID=3399129 RepID=UPI003A4E4A82
MERSLMAVLLAVGILLGGVTGAAYARARCRWDDYQIIKKRVPVLRRTAWLLIRLAATKIGVIALLLIGAVAYAAAGADHERATPTPTPTVTPMPRQQSGR